nr:DNA helicase [Tanacetum cinerariifolium]
MRSNTLHLVWGSWYRYDHYLDAFAICRKLGNPQFFITFTSNVNWPEIKRFMAQYPELTPSDRADVGLPHYHTLLWVDSASKIQAAEDVDMFISTEIPDPRIDQDGYNAVSEFRCMVHVDLPTQKPYAHNNVEYCGWSMLIKQMVDETENYVEGCFVCAHEAYWRILKFGIHRREPTAQVLSVHLQHRQRVTFRDRDRAACEALGLLGDDREWEIALEEACGSASSEQLRYREMGHDISTRVSQMVQIPDYHLNDDSLQGVTKNSQLGKLLADTDLIIWDEALMNDRRCFEALDRTLRDILQNMRLARPGISLEERSMATDDQIDRGADYHKKKGRLSDELRESVRTRDGSIEELHKLQMYDSSDEVLESIEILKSMQVDNMEKASRLTFMARE